jgi:hypothetical protein
MSPFNFITEIAGLFPDLGAESNDHRFAFLAATSRCELAVRDEIAYRLQRNHLNPQSPSGFFPGDFVVVREWDKRYDLAVLNPSGEAVCVVEFNAVATADRIRGHSAEIRKGYEKLVDDPDITKADKYVVLVVMLPEKKFDGPAVAAATNYLHRINRQFENGGTADGRKFFDGDWKNLLKGHGIKSVDPEGSRRVTIDAGRYAGVAIELDLFIVGPLIK